MATERDLLIAQFELEEELLRRAKGRMIDTFYATDADRKSYAAHMNVFKAGGAFRERCVLGANRSGKTTLGSIECAYHLTGQYPEWWDGYRFEKPTKIWACGESIAAARDIVQQKLLGDPGQWGSGTIPKDSIIEVRRKPGVADAVDVVRVRHFSGGVSEIGFKSYASQREDFQGVRRDFVWMDEEPSSPIYSECLLRTAATNPNEQAGRTLITATPLKGLSEIVQSFLSDGRLVENDDRYACQIGWDETPHLTEKEKAELIRGMSKHEVDARSKGHPSLGEGAVYIYSEDSLVIKPFAIPPFYFQAYGLDVGWNHTASVHIAINPDNGCIYVTDVYKAGQLSPHEHTVAIKLKADSGNGVASGAVDPAAQGRSQADGTRLIDDYRQQGLKIVPAVNEVHAGIHRIQGLIDSSQLKIFDRCKPLLAELRTYQWGKDGRPSKRNDHALDALRYAVMTEKIHLRPRPANYKPKKRKRFGWTK